MKKRLVLSIVPIFLILLGILAFYANSINRDNQSTTPDTLNIQKASNSSQDTLPTLAYVIANHPEATIFADAIDTFGYGTNLDNEDEYTVFLPYDTAYKNVPPETAGTLLTYEQPTFFRQVIEYHIVEGRYETKDFKDDMTLKTVHGENITLNNVDGDWLINGYSYIRLADVHARNGIIHTTDNFIFPPSMVVSQTTVN